MPQKINPMIGNQNAAKKGHAANLNIRCKPADRDAWNQQCRENNRPLTAWVIETLNKSLAEAKK
jgi:predicted HicB family RNase H-like nuclease